MSCLGSPLDCTPPFTHSHSVQQHERPFHAGNKEVPGTVASGIAISLADQAAQNQVLYLVQRQNQLAGTLSGGQQQMVSLARALLNRNGLLLVDEPTKGLAPRIVGDVVQTLLTAAQTVPILLVEQNLQVIRQLADRVVVLSGGRVVFTGLATELLDDPERIQRYLGVSAGAADPADAAVPQ
ncbi:ATP-binding cassette domain-containing protein [Cryobacterium psychrophilum]|uniref:ATP-binding cassette domain-containing protein n=1 Tax=Cryobacterium psychrophilum TaxID=41988 RepID=UPI0010EF97C8|nr:ABC transporter family protein [Cryobacterium psychrophilum]